MDTYKISNGIYTQRFQLFTEFAADPIFLDV